MAHGPAPDRTPSRPAAARVSKLALLVVYHVTDESLPMLDLHLGRVARHTGVPYTIYAVAHRVPPSARDRLRGRADVRLCDVAPVDARGSLEHGAYLDALAAVAADEGSSHLCTLDVDSFPIRDDWVDVVLGRAPAESGVAAVLRAENGDTALPHPSCTWMPRAFFEAYHPSFAPTTDGSREFSRFLRATRQRADTGIRLGFLMWREGLPWGRLLRTNAVDDHFLMAGVYGDAVFHMGASARGKVFRRDLLASRAHRLTEPLERLPLRAGRARQAQRRLVGALRRSSERRIADRNRAAEARIRGALFADPDAYLRRLRDGAA